MATGGLTSRLPRHRHNFDLRQLELQEEKSKWNNTKFAGRTFGDSKTRIGFDCIDTNVLMHAHDSTCGNFDNANDFLNAFIASAVVIRVDPGLLGMKALIEA